MAFTTAVDLYHKTSQADIKELAVEIAHRFLSEAKNLSWIGYSPILYYDGSVNHHNTALTESTMYTEIYPMLIDRACQFMRMGVHACADHLGIIGEDGLLIGYNYREGDYPEEYEMQYISIATKTPMKEVHSRIKKIKEDYDNELEEYAKDQEEFEGELLSWENDLEEWEHITQHGTLDVGIRRPKEPCFQAFRKRRQVERMRKSD